MGFLQIFFSQGMLLFPCLLIAAFAGLMCERTGVINIAINGQMVIGALLFAVFGDFANYNNQLSNVSQLLGLLIAALAGGVFSLIFAVAAISFKANQVVVGIAMNILASGIALFLTQSSVATINTFPTNYTPLAFDKTNIANLFLFVGILIAIMLYLFFNFTKVGTRTAACGENPNAVYNTGINVIRIRYFAVLVSGFLGGLAGAIYCYINANSFGGNVQGYGFVALAIMIFGQWRVIYIVMGALLFSLLLSAANNLTNFSKVTVIGNNIPLFKILPFLLTIVVMACFSFNNRAPLALGKPFVRSRRS